MGVVGGIRPTAARLQVLVSSASSYFEQPDDGSRHLQWGGGVQFFTLTVLLTQPSEVPFLENKIALQGW